MKYLKLYEGYVDDLNDNIAKYIKSSMNEIHNIMQVLMDDYNFEFNMIEFSDESNIKSFIYESKNTFELTEEFMKQLGILVKKCEQYDLKLKVFSTDVTTINGEPLSSDSSIDSLKDLYKLHSSIVDVTTCRTKLFYCDYSIIKDGVLITNMFIKLKYSANE